MPAKLDSFRHSLWLQGRSKSLQFSYSDTMDKDKLGAETRNGCREPNLGAKFQNMTYVSLY